jgi:hypothetical protein
MCACNVNELEVDDEDYVEDEIPVCGVLCAYLKRLKDKRDPNSFDVV